MPFKLSRRGSNEDVEVSAKDVIGMTEDELKAQLNKIDEVNTKLSAIDDIKATLAGLEGKLNTARGNNNGNNGGDNEVDGDVNNGGDVTRNVNPVLVELAKTQEMTLNTSINVIKSDMRRATKEDGFTPKYPYWDTFLTEMEKLTEKDPLAAKNKESYWEYAYSIILARHLDEIQNGSLKVKRVNFVEAGGSNGSGNVKTNTNEPSEIDKQQAAKFNIPIEKYMETKKKMVFVGV